MRIKAFVIIAIVYFFFNSFGLPIGVTYVMLLAPFLFFQLLPKYLNFFLVYGLCVIMYFIIHYFNGINNYFEYFKSLLLHTVVMILVVGFYNKLKNKPYVVAHTVELIAFLNLIAVVFSLSIIKIPFLSNEIWRSYFLTDLPQLRMLVYEPSFYSFLLVPLFFYFFNSFLNKRTLKNTILFLGIILALALSRSLGVVAAIVLSIIFTFFKFDFLKKKRNIYWLSLAFTFCLFSMLFVLILFPENVFIVRIENFLEGKDVSGEARIFDPWYLGSEIVQQKSVFFGIGWGHIKILGHEIISNFYNYGKSLNLRVGLPNSTAETFVMLGVVGLVIRILAQIYLYKRTRVKNSMFRGFMFWFIFIYQFTGSFSSNLVEYVVWVFAFTRIENFEFGRYSIINFKMKFSK
jgi:hypothetical protein